MIQVRPSIFLKDILFSENDIFLNMDKWAKKKNSNILFITGLSGSGKTTLMYDIAEEHHAEPIELDGIDDLGTVEVDHPFIHEYFRKNSNLQSKERLTTEEFVKAFDWIVKKCYQHPERLYVINGLQIYEDLNSRADWFYDKPLIIKGSGFTKSLIRQIKRRHSMGEPVTLKYVLNGIKMLKMSNKNLNDFKMKTLFE